MLAIVLCQVATQQIKKYITHYDSEIYDTHEIGYRKNIVVEISGIKTLIVQHVYTRYNNDYMNDVNFETLFSTFNIAIKHPSIQPLLFC